MTQRPALGLGNQAGVQGQPRPGLSWPLMVSVTTLQKLALTTHCSLNLNEDTCTALLQRRLTESCKSDRPFSLYFLGAYISYSDVRILRVSATLRLSGWVGAMRQLAPCACLPTSKTRGEQRRRRPRSSVVAQQLQRQHLHGHGVSLRPLYQQADQEGPVRHVHSVRSV